MATKADILRMLASISEQDGNEDAPKGSPKSLPLQARILRDMLPEVQAANPFKVGDLIEQRRECVTYKWPAPGTLGIVSRILEPHEKRLRPKGEARYAGREDIVVLCSVDDTWVEFPYESWRFQLYEGEIEP